MPDLGTVRENWEGLAQTDPLWAILSDPDKKGGKWDVDEFFASGAADGDDVLGRVASLGLNVNFDGAALDFGCGAGRLTQALAARFASAIGVDISATMVEHARRYNRFPNSCRYITNDRPDLRVIPDRSIDFIYTVLVLQHMHPRFARAYIVEFIRVLKPDGLLVFELPTRPLFAGVTNPVAELVLYLLLRAKGTLWSHNLVRHLFRTLRARVPRSRRMSVEAGPYFMEMHGISSEKICQSVREAGARVLHTEKRDWTLSKVSDIGSPRHVPGRHIGWESAWFYVTKGANSGWGTKYEV
jgi:SAM-dependent methyltransferase